MLRINLIFFILLQLKGLTDSQSIHVCTSGNGQQCNIDCETTDQNSNIFFTHPQYGSAGGCTSGGSCISTLGLGYSAARVNSTFTRLTIPSINCTTDRGDWTCSYGIIASTPVLLPCPTSIRSGPTIDVTGNTVTCQLNCQSPISGFSSLEIYKIQSGTTSLLETVTSINGSTPATADGCNSDEENVILTRDVSDVCGPSKFQCTFNNIYLGPANSSDSAEILLTGSADCIISTSVSPSITDQSTNMHATEQSSLAYTGDVVNSTVKSTTVPPPTTKPLLTEEEVLILAISLSVGVFMVIMIIIIVVFLIRSNKKGQSNKKRNRDKNNRRTGDKNNRSTGKQDADENQPKYTKYRGEGISNKQHRSDVGRHTSTSAKSFPQRSNKHNYNFYQPQILYGHNYGFQEGQSPYTEDNWDNYDYIYDNRAYSGNGHHGYTRNQSYPNRYPHGNDHHGYARHQSYTDRSEHNLYPSLQQSYTYY